MERCPLRTHPDPLGGRLRRPRPTHQPSPRADRAPHALGQAPTLLAAAFAGLALSTATGHDPGDGAALPLLALMALGGFGLGCTFSAILVHLTTAATPRFAPDISGLFTTSLQIAGSLAVATLGTIYAATATDTADPAPGATHGYTVVTALCAATALIAAATGHRATRLTQPTTLQTESRQMRRKEPVLGAEQRSHASAADDRSTRPA